MRKSQSQAAGKKKAQAKPNEPPPPPPRTEAAKQRAEASFGNRKTSNSRPPMSSDAHAAGNGSSRPAAKTEYVDANIPRRRPVPDPLSQFRESEAFSDSRQSTPYTAQGGEKFNPFDGVPHRAKSNRESQHEQHSSYDGAQDRSRSSSMPRRAKPDEDSDNLGVPQSEQRPSTGGSSAGAFAKSSFKERTGSNSSMISCYPFNIKWKWLIYAADSNQADGDEPSMYASYPTNRHIPRFTSPHHTTPFKNKRTIPLSSSLGSLSSVYSPSYPKDPETSQHQSPFAKLSPFEWKQHQLLSTLISNKDAESLIHISPELLPSKNKDTVANNRSTKSFSFHVNDDTFKTTSPNHASFAKNSVDDINTAFAAGQDGSSWKFNAGNDSQDNVSQQNGECNAVYKTSTQING